VAGGTPATAIRLGWCPTNRNKMELSELKK